MNRGYIRLYRKIQNNDLWTSEKFTKGQAWVDLILLAGHKPKTIWIRGVPLKLKRGDLAYSQVTLTKRWKWSRGKVKRFLSFLESNSEQQIVQRKNNLTTIISIVNYDLYQGIIQQTEQQTDSKQDSKRYTNNKDNKVNNTIYSAKRFEEWWKIYPKKVGKKDCRDKWKRRKLDNIADRLIQDVNSRIKSKKWQDGYIPNPLTYINGDRWEDETDGVSHKTVTQIDNEDLNRWKRSQSNI